MLNAKFDHFLLYSSKPEETYQFLKDHLQLTSLTPLTNYGSFQSGMFAFKNGILEILWYEGKTKEERANLPINQFVGFALQSDLDIIKTKDELESLGINTSELLEQKVYNEKNEEVIISEIVMLDHFFDDFQTFFIEYKNNYLRKRFEELSKESEWEIDFLIIEVLNQKEISNHFLRLGFKKENDFAFSDLNNIKIRIQEVTSENSIPSFVVKSKDKKIDIVKVLDSCFA
ncbi:hypothetical protein EHQ68_18380 [Leptospira congkakensis]|uniref:Uncharacterized protein n=1 Tax=Leptospira congkakensis TaxID=2484932 RepID=A0A4Z1A435_9LEPT|nr:hypothetical protein [Leptospira congkakensis]TGL84817.1 hypothetical protein EHQ68_18380 [Leptospira congkakensis]TGL92061.1 hypothetical protein EHQ69_08785 [Leptospira congkakensis]TGL96619.1 hypothetical protein EHQ70_08780 [Leptospira congkakensis]